MKDQVRIEAGVPPPKNIAPAKVLQFPRRTKLSFFLIHTPSPLSLANFILHPSSFILHTSLRQILEVRQKSRIY